MDGLLKCSRYAFGPNRLHYCGPNANAEVKSYIDHGVKDFGLARLLANFKNMYPYLQMIAEANQIADPFDYKVVEAYWLGNELLTHITKQKLYLHLVDKQKKRLKTKEFESVKNAISTGGVPHHNFHVLDVWKKTNDFNRDFDLESLDLCRISWGKITNVKGPSLEIQTRSLAVQTNKLTLGDFQTKKITRHLENEYDIEQLKPGQLVSLHWNIPCEMITMDQARLLDKLTVKHLAIANQNI